jgi:Ca-activated chloride channel family protein
MDYVFVLDVSGSMANSGKLPMSRQSLRSFIDSLGSEDRFEVITFNIAPTTLFNEARPANEENLKQAVQFLESQRALGGTVLRPAIETAYRYHHSDRMLNVVLLSDGMTEPADQAELIRLIGARPGGVRVFCIGVGNEVNRPLLMQLANDAGGLAAFLSHGDDFSRQAQAFRRKLMRPAVSNVEITFSGGNIQHVEPTRLPDLYHGAPLRIYGRYGDPGAVKVMIKGDVQGQPFEQSVDVNLPKQDDSNPEIERMWAWKRVDQLLAAARERGKDAPVIDEVVKLCEDFSIASEYASFIVLENDAEYQRWKIERRNMNRIERDRRAQSSLMAQLETMRNESLAKLGPQQGNAGSQNASSSIPLATSLPESNGSAPPVLTAPPDTGFDLNLPTGGAGGGAIDPISAAIGLGLAGAAAAAARRRKVQGNAAASSGA